MKQFQVSQHIQQPFVIREKITGELGLYASRNVNKGEHVLTFTGKIISFDEAIAKGKRMGDPLQIAQNIYLDTKQPGLYINHSCDPNCGLVDGIHIVAIRDIDAKEELTFDYSTTMNEGSWEMECNCDAPNCRKVVQDFRLLDDSTKKRYITLGIVPQFIIDSSTSTKLNTI